MQKSIFTTPQKLSLKNYPISGHIIFYFCAIPLLIFSFFLADYCVFINSPGFEFTQIKAQAAELGYPNGWARTHKVSSIRPEPKFPEASDKWSVSIGALFGDS